jgi:hypothetical protein
VIDLTTDGQEVFVNRNGLRPRCRAYWDVDALVFESELIRAGAEATNVVRYTLTNFGKTLQVDEQFRSSSLNYDNLWILDRSVPSSQPLSAKPQREIALVQHYRAKTNQQREQLGEPPDPR